MTIQFKDVGSYLDGVIGTATKTITAAGAGDAAYEAGATLDLLTMDHPLSGLAVVIYSTTLADTESLSMKIKLEHGDESDLSDAADYDFGGAEVDHGVLVTSSGGTTETGIVVQRVDLSGLKRYWRVSTYVDLSASGTDTVTFASGVVLGGQANMP
jgi:hypothetical protein